MVYKLPINKEVIMSLRQGYLEEDDTTWVSGKV